MVCVFVKSVECYKSLLSSHLHLLSCNSRDLDFT
jgi:hypothetical protein